MGECPSKGQKIGDLSIKKLLYNFFVCIKRQKNSTENPCFFQAWTHKFKNMTHANTQTFIPQFYFFVSIKMFLFSDLPHSKKYFQHNNSALCVISFKIRQIVLIATKMNGRWICSDVWFDILPFFDRPQLGLKLALLSPRFNLLVDKHFDGKSELTLWRTIMIRKDRVAKVPKMSVFFGYANPVEFPLPDRPLPNKIRFSRLQIWYIDHSVIAFLRSNQQIIDKGTDLFLQLYIPSPHDTDVQHIWDNFVREIWPVFAQNIRHLGFPNDAHLDNLRHHISPTILTELNIISIYSGDLLPDATDEFDEPNAIPTAGQMLSKWLHTPTKDGQPKRLHCYLKPPNIEWANTLKTKLLNATTSVRYKIQFIVYPKSTQIVPFELVNERTKEKLTLIKESENHWDNRWIIKRCQIGETAEIQWEYENLNDVSIHLSVANCIGPLSPSPAEQEKAGQSVEKGASSDK